MRREIYKKLLNWKNNPSKKPLLVFGARQVGKTYLIQQFGKENYEYVYNINFELDVKARNLFKGNLDVKTLLFLLSSYKSDIPIKQGKTLLFFDEVSKCPEVLTSLKSFALDGRFDVICSGSMLGIVMPEVSSYPVGYVETMLLRPMSFLEFLWANGYNDEQISALKSYYDQQIPLPDPIHETLTELFLKYVVVGGMPEVVKTFIQTGNMYDVLNAQKRIVNDYENDIGKYTRKTTREKVRQCFASIPDQLAKDHKKFQYKLVRQGGNHRTFGTSLDWINDAGLVYKIYKLKAFDLPLRAYRDLNAFKLYFVDTGLLLAFYEEDIRFQILNGELGIFKGAVFENVIAQCLINNGLPLYYYQKGDCVEIDFVTYVNNRIVPIEVKAGKNFKTVSLKNVINKEKLDYGIVFSLHNLNVQHGKIKYLPLYTVMFFA